MSSGNPFYKKKSFVFKERAGRAEEGWLRGEKKMEISSESAESEAWVEEAGVAAGEGEASGEGLGGIHRRIKMLRCGYFACLGRSCTIQSFSALDE